MPISKDNILGALPGLSDQDLETVLATASSLLNSRTGPKGQALTAQAAPFFNALQAALGSTMPYSAIANTSHATRFHNKVLPLAKYLDQQFPGWDKSQISQLAFLTMLFGLVVTDLKSRELTPSIGMLINNLPRIPSLLDAAFPDYVQGGLASIILKRFQHA